MYFIDLSLLASFWMDYFQTDDSSGFSSLLSVFVPATDQGFREKRAKIPSFNKMAEMEVANGISVELPPGFDNCFVFVFIA